MGITIEIQFIKGGGCFASPVTLIFSNSTSRNGLHLFDFVKGYSTVIVSFMVRIFWEVELKLGGKAPWATDLQRDLNPLQAAYY
jgi:hypothetical protein